MNALEIVKIDFFTYPNILLNNLDFLNSGFVRIGTDFTAILFLPACTIVSSVYVYSLITFNLIAVLLLYARNPLGASGTFVLDAFRTTQLPKCCNFFFKGEKCSVSSIGLSPITIPASPFRIGLTSFSISSPQY